MEDIRVLYPIHMNPAVRQIAAEVFAGSERIHMMDPVDVMDCHNLMARSYLILTDSGSIQEEAPSLGKPILVMRDTPSARRAWQRGRSSWSARRNKRFMRRLASC